MAAFNDLNDLRKAFERELRKEEVSSVENEQNLLKAITVYICTKKGVSGRRASGGHAVAHQFHSMDNARCSFLFCALYV